MTAWGWLACCLTVSQPASQRERERGKSLTKFELISKLSFNESSLTELQSWKKQTDKNSPGGGGGLNVYKCLVYIIMSSM